MGSDARFRRIADVKLIWDMDPRQLAVRRSSSWQRAGYSSNQAYSPIPSVPHEMISEMAFLESRLIDALEPEEYDDIAGEEVEAEFAESLPTRVPSLDLGVCAVTMGLASFGCVLISSCNGGAFSDYHQEDYPLIAFFCDRETYERLEPIFRQFKVGLSPADGGALLLFARDVRELVSLGSALAHELRTAAREEDDSGLIPH